MLGLRPGGIGVASQHLTKGEGTPLRKHNVLCEVIGLFLYHKKNHLLFRG